MSGPGKLDLVYRKQLDELTQNFEGALAAFGARLTRDETAIRSCVESQDTTFIALSAELGNLRREVLDLATNMSIALCALDNRINDLHNRRFTVRVRALLARVLTWTRSGSPPSSSVTFSSSPSPFPPPTDWDTDAAWKKPSEQYPIF